MIASAPPDSPVLVAVVTCQRDLDHALLDGWYRIPVARAPRWLAADFLALYQTGAFGPQGACIRYIAPISSWRICRRRDLLPNEPEHPRSDEHYYRLGLHPFEELPRPVPGGRLRRITFIPTTLGRLLGASSIRGLWLGREALTSLCDELRAEGFSAAERRLREECNQRR